MEDWTEEKSNQIIAEDTANSVVYDIDVTYTIPVNFKQRFLKDSRVKIGKYDYESSPLPEHLHRYLKDCDYVAGSSEFVCELFRKAGAGDSRVIRIPNGVDLKKFNKSIPKINLEKLGIKDKFVFLAVAEPHYRKQLDKLCEVYCETFKGKTDVCLLLKTRVADINVGFEQDIRPVLSSLLLKYGSQMPQIKLITTKIKDLASLYNACDAFVLPTVGEGWGMPFLEALACEKIVIAPNYGGQLNF